MAHHDRGWSRVWSRVWSAARGRAAFGAGLAALGGARRRAPFRAGLAALPLLSLLSFLAPAAPARAQAAPPPPEALLVVYGRRAPSREGDVDRREQVFFSVPADLAERLYLRVYDPEVSGAGDFTYGGGADSETTFRLFGGAGAFSAAERPKPVADGARAPARVPDAPITGPGRLLAETAWGSDRATDRRWVTMAGLRAAQGEVIDGRAYFRIDVQGSAGNDGNGFSLDVSLARDRSRPPPGLAMFAYQPTLRWERGTPPTQLRLARAGPGPLTVQSFDGAHGDLTLVTDFADLALRISGQDAWASDQVAPEGDTLALNLSGGFETPNDVTLSVFDGDGGPLPLTMPPGRAPVPGRPRAVASARPLADCRSVAFDASGSQGREPLSFHWDFGDGNSSAEPVIAHRYAGTGRFTARLRILEPGDRPGRGATLDLPVHVRDAPVAVAGPRVVVAPGQPVAFDGRGSVASDSPISRYRWSFGDGAVAEGAETSHAYARPGLYRAVLRVEDDSAHPCNFGVQTRPVVVNFPPVAEAGTDQQAVVGQPVGFSAAASYDIDGQIESYSWDMGDGTVLNGPSVSHVFAESGLYTVTLSVRDDAGVANSLARDRMTVAVNAPPVPRFDIPDRPLSVGEAGLFDASASADADGQILSYLWDFGDGATGEGPVVNYAWTRPGSYAVTLSVTDDSGTASARQSVTRQLRVDAAPVADAGPDQFVSASVVAFDGTGSADPDGRITAWHWDFGDGAQARGARVSHAYARPGSYEVALTVRDDSGAPLNTDRATMRVTVNAAPIADAGPPQVVAPGEEFILSGGASVDPDGAIAAYHWRLPDGRTARGERVAMRLDQPGLHRIVLEVTDDFAADPATDQAEVLITVNAPPVAVAGADRLIAPGDTVVFDAGQSFDPDGRLRSYSWSFDDLGSPLDAARVERAYPEPGIWSAQLVVTDDSGAPNASAQDDVTIRVNHPPVAEAGPPVVTDALHVRLDGSGSADADGDALIFRWDFGDGSPPVFGREVTHAYPRAGIFPVTLRVDDGTGLANARAIDATTVTIRARPLADAGGNREACSGEPILFDASGSRDPDGGLLLYSWDFGDGETSDLINPTKTYERPGTYPVTLRVQNETGTDHGRDIDRIAALVREGPIADAGPDRTVCSNTQVRFDGTGSSDADGAVNAFAWSFGDGGSGSGETPVHVFTRPGDYTVTLTITGEAVGACSPLDSDSARVTVIAAPELSVLGPDRAAAGQPAGFRAALDQAGAAQIENLRWDFGDGTDAEGAEIAHVWEKPGEYLVTLRARLSGGTAGCEELETRRRVIVNAAPEPAFTAPARAAQGALVRFDATDSRDPDGAITGHFWDFGDGTTARGVLASHRFDAPGRYRVTLRLRDDAGTGNSEATLTREIEIAPPPLAGLAAPGALCPGQPVDWALSPPEGTAVRWEFGDGTEAEGASVRHDFDRPGLYPVRVTLDRGDGLPSARRTEEIYARVNAAPTALAGPDRVVCPGDLVRFDAGQSGDLDGALIGFRWEFSDGVTLEGPVVERRFDAPGDLRLRLSVRDDSGATGCDSASDAARILVNAPPEVDAGPDRTVAVGAAHDVVAFDAGAARDPDGQGLRLRWDFGDGSTAQGASPRHRYAAPGRYTVTVEAADSTGLACGIARDSATITATARQ